MPALLVLIGVLLGAIAVISVVRSVSGPDPATEGPAGPVAQPRAQGLAEQIANLQQSLRTNPQGPAAARTWAQLGGLYVEQARVTGDPSWYGKAQGALEQSVQLAPDGNAEAMIGMGLLANARHDFAAARSWGEQARALRPQTMEVYGVLADAYTQLGQADAATAAVQSMLDLRPGLASFTRASYDLELHGRVDEARSALERALGDAITPADTAFCRYYLGELAWNSGRVDEAADQYEKGLAAAPGDPSLLQGRAKVAWARGDLDGAIAGYRDLTSRLPLPQYLLEYGELLQTAGRAADAQAQYDLLAAQEALYAAQGATDNVVSAQVAADHGDKGEALRLAQDEWNRRQSVFSADALAWALHVNGRDAEAIGYAEKAAALGGRNAAYSYHRGMILTALGRTGPARDALNEALGINPHFNPLAAATARDTLSRLGG